MSYVIVSYKYLIDVLHESDGGHRGSTEGPLWGVVERSADHHDKCPNAAFINYVHMLQLILGKISYWVKCYEGPVSFSAGFLRSTSPKQEYKWPYKKLMSSIKLSIEYFRMIEQ